MDAVEATDHICNLRGNDVVILNDPSPRNILLKTGKQANSSFLVYDISM